MKRILFITHELSRTGAPMILLHLGRWLKANRKGFTMDLLTLGEGNMRVSFAQVFDAVLGPMPKSNGIIGFLQRRIHPEGWRERLFQEVAKHDYRVIYANTVLAIPAACRLKQLGGAEVRVVAHVHELNNIIRMFLPDFSTYIDQIDRFIAVSQLVRDELVERWGVPADRITVVYEFSEVGDMSLPSGKHLKEGIVVGGSGLVHWRKGHDLFIQVAQCMRSEHPEVPATFIWVGRIDDRHKIIVQGDLERSGLSDRVRFLGELEDPLPAFHEMDLMILTSREDPFPLVCIEAGMLGKPVLCFKGATGIAEVLTDGGGFVVPYLDVKAMANHIAALWHDPDLLAHHSEKARSVFGKFTPEDRCPAIGTLIDELLVG